LNRQTDDSIVVRQADGFTTAYSERERRKKTIWNDIAKTSLL